MKVRAIRIHKCGPPSVLKWDEIDVPNPKADQVLLRHTAIGFNFADTYFRNGLYKVAGFPAVIGIEGAGVIEAAAGRVPASLADVPLELSDRGAAVVVGATVVVVDTAATSTGDADSPCPQAVAPTRTAVRTARVARASGRIGTRGHGARTGCLVQDVGPAVGWQAAADPGTHPTVSPHDHEIRKAPQAVSLGHL